jgi:type II secretory pathway component GspD/PulD (secretin)/tetratricopeptide (TPR) repeat protein
MWSILFATLALAGCASSEPAPEGKPADQQPPAPGQDQKPPEARPEPAPGPQDEWGKRMAEFTGRSKVAQEEQDYMAQEHYRLAEKYFQEGRLENAEMSCREALRYNPSHAGAKALLYETQILLGQGKATPQSEQMEKAIQQMEVRQKEVQLEIDQHFNLGMRHYNSGDYESAERSFRLIIEYAKWVFPPTIEIDTRKQQALDMLQKTKQSRKQRDIDQARIRSRLIEEEERRIAITKVIEQKKELEILFGQAQMHFEREEYDQCMWLCDKILFINPNLSSVAEMKIVAQRLKWMKRDERHLDEYIRQWKKMQNHNEWIAGIPTELIEFPEINTWMEIAKRRPRTLKFEVEGEMAEGDRQILDKLKAMKFTFNFTDAPLKEVIDFIRDSTGLNFVFDKDVDSSATVSIKVQDISVEALLKYVLQPSDLTFYVDGGLVIISTKAAFSAKNLRLEIYDVQDITFRLLDMPGREITFGDEGVTFVDQPAEAQPQFGGEDLVQLIRDTIDKPTWDEEGHSINFQNGLLIVKTLVDTHKKITKFLTMLRGSTGILVHIEARFMFVDDNWLQQVGMDFVDVPALPGGGVVAGLVAAAGGGFGPANPANLSWLTPFPYFITTNQGAGNTSGIQHLLNPGGNFNAQINARVQNLMFNDFLRNKFFQDYLGPVGGGTFIYGVQDDVTVNAFIRLVSKSQKGYILVAPRLTMFNTQRAHIQISNQMAYVKDWNLGGGGFQVIPDPIIDVISDGIILDVKPIVSADRKFITLEMRATVALLFPPPPQITQIIHGAVGGVVELPFVRMQKVKTTVVIPDGGVLVLGGFAGYYDFHAESGIPIWKHIPVLGQLGKEELRGKGRRQILVILRGDIIIPSDEEKKRFD